MFEFGIDWLCWAEHLVKCVSAFGPVMVDVDGTSLMVETQPKSIGWSKCWLPPGISPHSRDERAPL